MFARLAEGLATGVTVVTPKQRLALAQAASEARKAWELAHLRNIAGAMSGNTWEFPGNEDAEAFAQREADYRFHLYWLKKTSARCGNGSNTRGR